MHYKKAYIEISNICNLQCSFCPEVEREKKIMSVELFSQVLQQAAPLAEEICLHLMGEPLAHPHFPRIVAICQEKGVQVNLTTNGVLLKRHPPELLLQSCFRQINFSLHSFKDNFPLKDIRPYLQNILQFTLEAQRQRPDLYINYRLWNLQGQEIQDDHHLAAKSNDQILQQICEFFQCSLPFQADVTWKKSKRIQGRLYLHFDSRFDWPSLRVPPSLRRTQGYCPGPSTQFGVLADGTVVPCCLDKEAGIPLGHCSRQDLASILQGERARQLREGLEKFQLREELCQGCSFIQRFDHKVKRRQLSPQRLREREHLPPPLA